MGQFGLLAIPVLLVMMLIFSQDVLYRDADFSIVVLRILATAVIGAVYSNAGARCSARPVAVINVILTTPVPLASRLITKFVKICNA